MAASVTRSRFTGAAQEGAARARYRFRAKARLKKQLRPHQRRPAWFDLATLLFTQIIIIHEQLILP